MRNFTLRLVVAWAVKASLGIWLGLLREGPTTATGAPREVVCLEAYFYDV